MSFPEVRQPVSYTHLDVYKRQTVYITVQERVKSMSRKKIIAGNWKMNKTPSEAVALVEELKPLVANEEVDVVFCVPAIDIVPVVEAVKGTNIQVGAENMYFEESGAYTGEISPAMLVDAGVKYVVLGHSERRDYFGETNEDVNKKVLKAFEHGITPVSYTHLVENSSPNAIPAAAMEMSA